MVHVKLLYSWSRNYCTYEARYDSPFEEPLVQQYFMIGLERDLSSLVDLPISITAELGIDRGDLLGNRAGMLLSAVYDVL